MLFLYHTDLTSTSQGEDGSEEPSEADDEEVEEPLVNRLVLEYNKDLTSSIAAADALDVLHKASHWKEELTSESPFGAVLELKSDQTVRVLAKVKNVEPGTYVPMARVKLHYFAKLGSPEWSTTYEGELGTVR